MSNNWFQNFFDTKPALAGIILAFVISGVIFIIFGFYYLFRKSKNKSKKIKTKEDKNNNLHNNNIENKDKKESTISYFRLNIDKNGKFVIKNDNESDDSYKLVESKDHLLQIINSKEQDLILPIGKIVIMLNPNYNNESEKPFLEKNRFVTSYKLFDNNLYVYKLFVRYMDDAKNTWLRSKFS